MHKLGAVDQILAAVDADVKSSTYQYSASDVIALKKRAILSLICDEIMYNKVAVTRKLSITQLTEIYRLLKDKD